MTLEALIQERRPDAHPRNVQRAFDRALPDYLRGIVHGWDTLDETTLKRVQARFEAAPYAGWRAALDDLGHPETGGAFIDALRLRLERVVDDAVAQVDVVVAERIAHPPLDLSGVPDTLPRLMLPTEFIATSGASHGRLSVAAYDCAADRVYAREEWRKPDGGFGGTWRWIDLAAVADGWVRDPNSPPQNPTLRTALRWRIGALSTVSDERLDAAISDAIPAGLRAFVTPVTRYDESGIADTLHAIESADVDARRHAVSACFPWGRTNEPLDDGLAAALKRVLHDADLLLGDDR